MHNEHEPLDRDIAAALDALDYALPPVAAGSIVQRARARRAQRRVRFAAAAVVLLAASAAAALPGSPVRRWVVQTFGDESSASTPVTLPAAPQASEPARAPDMRGIVLPVQDSISVHFAAPQSAGDVVIRVIPGAELRLSASDSTPRFLVRQGGVNVNNRESQASYELAIWDAADISIFVGPDLRFVRRDGRVLTGPSPQDDGSVRLSLQGAARR